MLTDFFFSVLIGILESKCFKCCISAQFFREFSFCGIKCEKKKKKLSLEQARPLRAWAIDSTFKKKKVAVDFKSSCCSVYQRENPKANTLPYHNWVMRNEWRLKDSLSNLLWVFY